MFFYPNFLISITRLTGAEMTQAYGETGLFFRIKLEEKIFLLTLILCRTEELADPPHTHEKGRPGLSPPGSPLAEMKSWVEDLL